MKMERPSRAHIFLSRLHLDSNEGDIENYLRSVNIEWTDIEKLPEKFAGQDYSSFHLTLLKGERDYDDFLDPNLWPEGSFYKRWFTPRVNNHRGTESFPKSLAEARALHNGSSPARTLQLQPDMDNSTQND